MIPMRRSLIASLLIATSSFCCVAQADADAFSTSYHAYLAAVENKDLSLTESTAAAAYELGIAVYGEQSIDTANLAINWANAILAQDDVSADNKSKAYKLYAATVTRYEQIFGDEAIELLEPLTGLADSTTDVKEAKALFSRVLDIAQKSSDKMLLADMQMAAFNRLKNTPQYTFKVRDYLFSALETYETQLPENSLVRVKATFLAGLIQYSEHKESEAIPYFETVVEQFEVLDYDHPYKLSAHAKLVELYSKQGERQKSTQHCIAIGSMKPWADTQEQMPLYRKPPVWPKRYLKKGREGSVELTFTIDEQGFVIDPQIVKVQGGKKFGKSTLEALVHWRFAPKFEDGQAVKADSRVRIDYTLN